MNQSVLFEKLSDRLFDTIDKIYRNIIPKEIVESINVTLPLTAFQANRTLKKSKVYKCTNGKIPCL